MIELVWDKQSLGTATAASGVRLTVGDDGVTPDELLCMAAAGCIMRTFLRLAEDARVTVLGYVTSARVEAGPGPSPARVHVRSSVVTPRGVPGHVVDALCRQAQETSTVSRVLGPRLTIEHDVRQIDGSGNPAGAASRP